MLVCALREIHSLVSSLPEYTCSCGITGRGGVERGSAKEMEEKDCSLCWGLYIVGWTAVVFFSTK